MASITNPDARNDLTKRVLAQMTLSQASNPLTAPLPLPKEKFTPSERARRRFAIEGNAIVTGAGGIGLSAIRALLEHGASGIAIFDVPVSYATSTPAIDDLKKDFPQAKIATYNVDVRDEELVNKTVDLVTEDFGAVDMLLCFAGVVGCEHAHELKADDWKRVMDVNVTGSWFCAQAVGKKMIAQKSGGSILFTASISGHRVNFPQPQVAYNTSKAAVLQLTRSLAAEWSSFGIRVNSLSPGYMDTILNEGAGLAVSRAIWADRNPMGRMGDVEELSGAVILLCSKQAGRYINGVDIVVDGGGIIF
ncbi:uncharacterized protein C8R40DRAFT_839198 [Lentinula edodes]|uniref:uncharacterized protein n=1 Tax=Lentinula edodes TaxID=5353 RepID=UPI001BF8523E|nr:uncharacterized protein C8R40DRAFT_839198 [Lentinula edodes]KAF8830738.1 hypothetical protein HHX47_DHR2000809 [Lentinula edodes]KAH7868471.1 hypothetical protein C8R40DRAFT_839198 [Lentinula edodes]